MVTYPEAVNDTKIIYLHTHTPPQHGTCILYKYSSYHMTLHFESFGGRFITSVLKLWEQDRYRNDNRWHFQLKWNMQFIVEEKWLHIRPYRYVMMKELGG